MDEERPIGNGIVALCYDDWYALLATLEGDTSHRDNAFDALHRWVPSGWLDAFDQSWAEAQHSRATADTSTR